MAATYRVQSVCECQAILEAELDERRLVLSGTARKNRGARENAPAITLGADAARFEACWQCPFCGRNTLRRLNAGALRKVAASTAA